MKDTLKFFISILLKIIAFFYFLGVILLSLFILKENEYGYTQIKDTTFVIINEYNNGPTTEEGMLVVVKNIGFNKLIINDEVYVYENSKNNIIARYGILDKINDEEVNKYIELKDVDASYKEEYIIGVPTKKITKIGEFIEFLSQKYTFMLLVLLPSSLIAVYEIYYIFKNFIIDRKKED